MAKKERVTINRSSHKMVYIGPHIDSLSGEEWDLYLCPIDGYLRKIHWDDPYQDVDLNIGEGMLTPEDRAEMSVLKNTPGGRAECARRLARQPNHVAFKMPDDRSLREMARQRGCLKEFDVALAQAVANNEPLFTLSMGGQRAVTVATMDGPRERQN